MLLTLFSECNCQLQLYVLYITFGANSHVIKLYKSLSHDGLILLCCYQTVFNLSFANVSISTDLSCARHLTARHTLTSLVWNALTPKILIQFEKRLCMA